MNPSDLTDEQFDLHQARQSAAAIYRSHGYDDFAAKVARGEEDGCSQVRLAQWMREAPGVHSERPSILS